MGKKSKLKRIIEDTEKEIAEIKSNLALLEKLKGGERCR